MTKPERPDFNNFKIYPSSDPKWAVRELTGLISAAKEYIEYLEAQPGIDPSDFCHAVCDMLNSDLCQDHSRGGLCLKNAKSVFKWIHENGYRIVKK